MCKLIVLLLNELAADGLQPAVDEPGAGGALELPLWHPGEKKQSFIQETLNLLTCADKITNIKKVTRKIYICHVSHVT